jgi:hypothetical protein
MKKSLNNIITPIFTGAKFDKHEEFKTVNLLEKTFSYLLNTPDEFVRVRIPPTLIFGFGFNCAAMITTNRDNVL